MGGTIGGIIYSGVSKYLRTEHKHGHGDTHHVYAALKVNYGHILLIYEGVVTLALVLASLMNPNHTSILNPIIGGMCIGGAQLVSLVLTESPVGVSTSYEDIGKWFWKGIDVIQGTRKKGHHRNLPSMKSLTFGGGIMLGALALIGLRPEFAQVDTLSISPFRAIVGGAVMIIGARIAGGCTSGHGISGMSMFCISSILTVVSMFGGGIGATALFNHL